MSFRKKKPSAIDGLLPSIPFEVLIGCFAEKRRSVKSFSARSDFGEETRRNTFSGKSSLYSLANLRTKFEDYLRDNLPTRDSEIICQQLQFLDAFCEPMRIKGKSFDKARDLFYVCNHFLYELIKGNEQDGSVIIQNNVLDATLLTHFDTIVDENGELLPVFTHEYLKSWFIAKQTQLIAWKEERESQENEMEVVVKSDTDFQDCKLSILINMFANQMQGHFCFFQEKNSKYCKKWMRDNVSELPNHLFEGIKSLEAKNQKFREHLANKEDMTNSTILDLDFEVITQFSQYGNSWKMLNISKLNQPLSFSSQINYSGCPGTKSHKVVYYVPYNIIQLSKAMLSYKYEHEEDMYKLGDVMDYQKLDINNSKKKYSTVIRPVYLQAKAFVPKRQTVAVFASKGKFIGNELVEMTLLYKTCNNDLKNQYKTIGGVLLHKDDTNSTRVTEMKMYNVGGLFQTELVLTLLASRFIKNQPSITGRMIQQVRDCNFVVDEEGNPGWRTFCEYCREHCKVDPNSL